MNESHTPTKCKPITAYGHGPLHPIAVAAKANSAAMFSEPWRLVLHLQTEGQDTGVWQPTLLSPFACVFQIHLNVGEMGNAIHL